MLPVARRMGISVEQLEAIDAGTIDSTLGQVRRYAHAVGVLVEHSVVEDVSDERVDSVVVAHKNGVLKMRS